MAKLKPLVLTILDGWGYRAGTEGNAVALARKPTYDHLLAHYPHTLIHTSGPSVGLPEGQIQPIHQPIQSVTEHTTRTLDAVPREPRS